MKYREYPDIEIPAYLQDWDDSSWHNDVTASSTKVLDSQLDLNVVVWVSPANPQDREYADMPRFMVSIYQDGNCIEELGQRTEAEMSLPSAVKLAVRAAAKKFRLPKIDWA